MCPLHQSFTAKNTKSRVFSTVVLRPGGQKHEEGVYIYSRYDAAISKCRHDMIQPVEIAGYVHSEMVSCSLFAACSVCIQGLKIGSQGAHQLSS